jgi:hypothetical protein
MYILIFIPIHMNIFVKEKIMEVRVKKGRERGREKMRKKKSYS